MTSGQPWAVFVVAAWIAAGCAGTSGEGASGSGGAGGTGAGCLSACPGFDCCNGACVNFQNDVKNCGGCGNECPDPYPYCDNGKCGTPTCGPTIACGGACCGNQCCADGELCCLVQGPIPAMTPSCTKPNEQGTCPMGCTMCVCNGPDTPIATPDGERPIASLREGELVYSVEDGAVVVVPIALALHNPVTRHEVVRLTLGDGVQLEVSAGHPLMDGRAIGDLRAGAEVEGVRVQAVETAPYLHPFTYDILPASRTGAYYAGGMLLRSTLNP